MDQSRKKILIPTHVRRHFSAFEKSGLSIRAYCRKASIADYTFYAWRNRYRCAVSPRADTPRFEEIALPFSTGAMCEIIFPGGTRVIVNRSSGSGADELAAVVRTLSSANMPC